MEPGSSRKLIVAAVTLLLLSVLFIRAVAVRHVISEQALQEQDIFNRAGERFNELCLGAGYKIHRTVENVDSLLLLKVRPVLTFRDQADPMLPGAAMAGEAFGEAYIKSFLGGENHDMGYARGGRGSISEPAGANSPRYRYVDAIDEMDGRRYRYSFVYSKEKRNSSGVVVQRAGTTLVRELATGSAPRYAVDYEDIVNSDDRLLWIAGSIVRVLDQQTGEVLGQYTSYLQDAGMGVTSGVRAPWSHASRSAYQCPSVDGASNTLTRYFVDQVLRPAHIKAQT